MNDLFTRSSADLRAPPQRRLLAADGASHHDPPARPGAGWADGVVFVCRSCDEQVRVAHREADAPTRTP